MKKAILIAAFALITAASFAQSTKKDTLKAIPKYEYFVKVPPQVYREFLNIIHEYRDGVIYLPAKTSDEKVKTQQQIDEGLYNLRGMKIDSAVIGIKK